MCAERVAVFSAIAAGAKSIRAVALRSDTRASIAPCGACRQVLSEFCLPSTPVYSQGREGEIKSWTIETLLPIAFSAQDL
jgi:cytidine deaminase